MNITNASLATTFIKTFLLRSQKLKQTSSHDRDYFLLYALFGILFTSYYLTLLLCTLTPVPPVCPTRCRVRPDGTRARFTRDQISLRKFALLKAQHGHARDQLRAAQGAAGAGAGAAGGGAVVEEGGPGVRQELAGMMEDLEAAWTAKQGKEGQ